MWLVLIMGLLPAGALLGGVLGALAGPRVTLLAAGLIPLVAPIVLHRALRGIRDVDGLLVW